MRGPDVACQRVLLKAGILTTAAQRALWFGDARLVGHVWIAPTHEDAGFFERNFLVPIRAVMPSLELRVDQISEAKKSEKKAYTGKVEPTEKQRDLL